MTHFGLYEAVVDRTLEQIGPAPWAVADPHQGESRVTSEECQGIHPHCQPRDVIDWLRSLSPADQQELVAHLNAEQPAKGRSR